MFQTRCWLRVQNPREFAIVHYEHEHRSTRFCLFEALSLDGAGDAGLRHYQHADGGRVSGGHEADHR